MVKAEFKVKGGNLQSSEFKRYISLKAKELGLKGYMKDFSTHELEIIVEGDKKKVEKFYDFVALRKAEKGPSKVEKITKKLERKSYDPNNNYSSFKYS